MRPFAILFLAAFFARFAAFAQAQDPGHRTVAQANSYPTGLPPRGGSWSPDGKLYTFTAADDRTLNGSIAIGQPGDIVAIEAATGRAFVLATVAQLSTLTAAAINEKDRDHRNRYAMSSYVWADDSKHLIIDNGGPLWLYSIAEGTGKLIVDTQSGSGDDPKFSPDARSVSYLRNHNIYVHSVGPGAEVALTQTTPATTLNGEVDWVYLEELEVRSNYFWSPDSHAIAYLQMDEAAVPSYPITDFIPTHPTIDQQRFPLAGDPNPQVRVGIVPAGGGPTRLLQLPIAQGNDYIPRFGWVDAKTVYVEVLTRNHQDLKLYLADAATGRTRLIHTDHDAKYLEDNYDVTFTPGHFFNTSWQDGHTHIYLYSFDVSHPLDHDAALKRQLTTGSFEVSSPELHGDTMFFSSTESAVAGLDLWSIRLDGTHKTRLTSAPGVHEASVSPDGRHFADVTSNSSTAPIAQMCGTGQTCTPFWRSSPVPDASGVQTRRVTFTAADGRTPLYGVLTVPTDGQKIPIILNPYGGPLPYLDLKNAWSYGQLFDEVLAQHGFAVLHVENRGEGGRGREFAQANYRNFGSVQLADQLAALDQVLAANPALDPARTGFWGWSWGGTFTLYAMTHSTRFKAGVAVAPTADYRNYDTVYTERYLGLPSENAEAYDAAAVVRFAANLKGRLLIAQGTGDDNVHMQNTIQFLEPLIDAGIPYDLQLFPRKTHSIAGIAARNELFSRILIHFETYLK